ncbi:metal-dependent hydrolase [Pyrococcus furiosus DSM 3638]|uniref:Metal-dependent hydrolase n=3 Tax=Pyrococcus furiosus TaxID=2261 RepID=A0A5C0XMH8_PYRFU|nr:metal-dependent hydrolase [Pyrococcus furiosus]AAL80253.1 hypothetical protein PF0129 [Pyrococcus furiosus DSM 3638]AFN04447.1 hypothetical protein PFC_07555 [Pyrococcus furiosus COM1]QEK77859.1 metal-dependent hydrolase [Pyrococcus furiosus DSM 3638]
MNYEEHVLAGLMTYPLAILLALYLPLKVDLTFYALALGYAFYVLGSDLPDIDHPDSLIHRGSKPLFSVALGSIVAMKILPYLENYNLAIFLAWVVGAVFAVIGWFTFSALLPRHRGVVHSITFALIYAGISYLAVNYGLELSKNEAMFVSLSAFLGYLLHLILDKEIKLL